MSDEYRRQRLAVARAYGHSLAAPTMREVCAGLIVLFTIGALLLVVVL